MWNLPLVVSIALGFVLSGLIVLVFVAS
jgi:hypothetical protein